MNIDNLLYLPLDIENPPLDYLDYLNNLNDAQKAVLEPPYANRLDRPNIVDPVAGTVEITQRSDRKRQHDKEVFKTKYF